MECPTVNLYFIDQLRHLRQFRNTMIPYSTSDVQEVVACVCLLHLYYSRNESKLYVPQAHRRYSSKFVWLYAFFTVQHFQAHAI